MTVGQARRGLAIYFAVLIPVTAIIETLIIRADDNIGRYQWLIRRYPWLLILLLMWTPAISSIVARLALREGFADVSFRLGGRQALPAGPHPGISAAIFLVGVVGIGYVIGILRLRSGSVWPAALLHGEWNGIIQGPFDGSATGPGATTWVGESGILVAAVVFTIGIIAWLIYARTPVRDR